MTPAADDGARCALVATLAIQVYTSFAATAPAVLAPVLAPDLGITPNWIGVFVGLLYAGAMLGSLGCGEFVARYGAIRVSQACVLFCAVGHRGRRAGPGSAAPLLVGRGVSHGHRLRTDHGRVVGACWRGPRRQDRMALTFSIKQTGVPAGAALAGRDAARRGAALPVGGPRSSSSPSSDSS